MSPRPRSATDGHRAGTGSAPTAGERFARALAAKDSAALCEVLADTVDFQALTPGRHWQASTVRQAVEEIILGHWFDAGDNIAELCSVAAGREVKCTRAARGWMQQRRWCTAPAIAEGGRAALTLKTTVSPTGCRTPANRARPTPRISRATAASVRLSNNASGRAGPSGGPVIA